jgi:hypothetical protein
MSVVFDNKTTNINDENYCLLLKNMEYNNELKYIQNKIIKLQNKISIKLTKKTSLTLELEIIILKSKLDKEIKKQQNIEHDQLYLYKKYISNVEMAIINTNNDDFKHFISHYQFEPDIKLKVTLKQLYNHFQQYDKNKMTYRAFNLLIMNNLKLFTTNKGRTDRIVFYGIKLRH